MKASRKAAKSFEIRLPVLHHIWPLRVPGIVEVVQVRSRLAEPVITTMKIPPFGESSLAETFELVSSPTPDDVSPFRPQLSDNLALVPRPIEALGLSLRAITGLPVPLELQTPGFLVWTLPTIELPKLLSLFDPLEEPSILGKAYNITRARRRVDRPTRISKERCKHGLMKSTCSICTLPLVTKRLSKTTTPTRLDLFELIFPVLQPPLGHDFDNIIVMPADKHLFAFQPEGVRFLAEHESALLADEMGLGKSIMAITAIRLLLRQGKITTTLVLCPKSVLLDWDKKFWEWAPEVKVVVVRGPKAKRRVLWQSRVHVLITTYETLRQDIDSGAVTKPDLCILDEVQKIKNPGAHLTKAARRVNATYRWGLSGTPLENRAEELIAIMAYLKPGLLRESDADKPRRIRALIRPYFLRRRIADVELDLPPKVPRHKWLELTLAQRQAYRLAEETGIVKLTEKGELVTVQHVLALITKLKQICNFDPATQQSAKLDYLEEQLDQLVGQGNKALVFSQYPNKTLTILKPKLKRFGSAIFHGGLSDTARDRLTEDFQNLENPKVLLMSVKAGGTGITLTRANHVFHFDLWWNPAVARQAEGRAHRIGQEQTVFATSLFTRDTIEERIYDLLERKQALFDEVIEGLSDRELRTSLTEDELFGLFGLTSPKARRRAREAEVFVPADDIGDLSPREFEHLVAALFEAMGFDTRMTPLNRDQGIDVFAKRRTESGWQSLIIQCKHYQSGQVGPGPVRELFGVLQTLPDVSEAVLVTSGFFTAEARRFAEQTGRIRLIAGIRLNGLLAQYRPALSSYSPR